MAKVPGLEDTSRQFMDVHESYKRRWMYDDRYCDLAMDRQTVGDASEVVGPVRWMDE